MIDSIYRLVQELLNKNGYGILSPARFMLFAENSQIKILDNYIEEYRAARTKVSSYSSNEKMAELESIIEYFSITTMLSRNEGGVVNSYHLLPSDYMMWGGAFVDNTRIEKVSSKKKNDLKRDYFLSPTTAVPVCYIESNKLYVLPDSIGVLNDNGTLYAVDEVELSYYRYPLKPKWTYTTVSGKAVFNINSSSYQDFELPYAAYNRLVIDILAQAGLHIRDESAIQYAINEDNRDFQKDNNQR